MHDIVKDALSKRIQWTHQNIISIGEALTEEQLAHQPGPTSPPIGWHIWHASRWADRLQASFQIDHLEGSYEGALVEEIWKKENLAQEWDLEVGGLGLLETGATMDVETATAIAGFDKTTLIGYARHVFESVVDSISALNAEILFEGRCSILPEMKKKSEEKPIFAGDRHCTVFDDLLFHATHAGRHLGMMEALRGTLFGVPGSVSI